MLQLRVNDTTMAGAIPGARSVLIPEATHVMFDQAPDQYSRIVLEFLAEGA